VVFVLALVVSIMMTIHAINARNRMTTATTFSFDGVDFVRIQTTLLTAEGKPAINTKLDRESASYHALVQNYSYRGEATIFARKYDTYYAPLTNAQGKLDGAIFVGNQK
jgi:methyl-accepting chemotaxis protein-2 (aspartate sensor receptor)